MAVPYVGAFTCTHPLYVGAVGDTSRHLRVWVRSVYVSAPPVPPILRLIMMYHTHVARLHHEEFLFYYFILCTLFMNHEPSVIELRVSRLSYV